MAKLSPSILSADFANLERDVKIITDAGADWIHVDVMDGHFVPNISIGVPVVTSLRKATDGFLDVHLMITDPDKYVPAFIKAGADLVNFHVEVECDIEAVLKEIKAAGKKTGLTIKPNTPPEAVFPYLHLLDMVLVMSVEPGFGGQSFMPNSIPKIKVLKKKINELSLNCEIEIDGGINLKNAPEVIEAGCDILVAGSSVFNAPDVPAAVKAFKAL
ncbi:MAG: ribulose-phosphate 3-epimerase [Firmicutes bacterium]|nr:ribulose-phosphate 3-epimerase [Bacillota bacterium]